jgi:hypothetical protein
MRPDNKDVNNKYEPTFRFEMKAIKGQGLKMIHENVSYQGG